MVFCNNNKLRATLLHDETASVVLKNILVKMDSEEFGKRRSERLVGGPKTLVKLVEKGAIRMRIDDNGRAYYNASDVLMNCRVKTTRNKRLVSV
jgi:hypothetical protein